MAAVGGRTLALGALGVVLGSVVVHFVRHLPWSLSAIVGFAIGVLVVYSLRSGARIRAAWGGERWQREGERDDGEESGR